jgi:hypothetical protein
MLVRLKVDVIAPSESEILFNIHDGLHPLLYEIGYSGRDFLPLIKIDRLGHHPESFENLLSLMREALYPMRFMLLQMSVYINNLLLDNQIC